MNDNRQLVQHCNCQVGKKTWTEDWWPEDNENQIKYKSGREVLRVSSINEATNAGFFDKRQQKTYSIRLTHLIIRVLSNY